MINLAISGCLGRMGKSIARLACEQNDLFTLKALIERCDHPDINSTVEGISVKDGPSHLKECDTLIEFTSPEATILNLNVCVTNNIKMVIGTTGLEDHHIEQIKKASETIPIVYASNMSIGVNVLFKMIQTASQKLEALSNISLTEAHHIHKKDKPSGTAKTMARLAEETSGKKVSGVESIREGEIVGDHSITFETEFDTLTLSHHAKNRDMFAKGSLTAALFLKDKSKGLYTMQDVLDLN